MFLWRAATERDRQLLDREGGHAEGALWQEMEGPQGGGVQSEVLSSRHNQDY